MSKLEKLLAENVAKLGVEQDARQLQATSSATAKILHDQTVEKEVASLKLFHVVVANVDQSTLFFSLLRECRLVVQLTSLADKVVAQQNSIVSLQELVRKNENEIIAQKNRYSFCDFCVR